MLSVKRASPLVLKALEDPDVEVRLLAAQAAARLHVATASDLVVAWLSERDPRLKLAACDIARATPSPKLTPHLSRALGDADPKVRASAADALAEQAEAEAVPPLLGRLDDPNPQVRLQVVRALGRRGDARAVIPLVGKVQDSVPDVRQAVARALGDLGDASAQQALAVQLRDANNDVRIEAIRALGRLGAAQSVDALAALLTDRVPGVRQAAIQALGRLGTKEAVRALVPLLGTGDDAGGGLEPSAVRLALVSAGAATAAEMRALLDQKLPPSTLGSAALVLGMLGAKEHAPSIVLALRRGALPVPAALHALGATGQAREVPVVLEYLSDPSPFVRTEAVRAAATLLSPDEPDGRAVEPILSAMRLPSLSESERVALVSLLGRTGAPRATPTLVQLVGTKERALRVAAIDALGALGQGGADTELVGALAAPEADIRLRAALALGRTGGINARDAIIERLSSTQELDRGAHLTALAGILHRGVDLRVPAALTERALASQGPERAAYFDVVVGSADAAALSQLLQNSQGPVDDRSMAKLLASPRVPSATATTALRRFAASADEETRASALLSLGQRSLPEDIATQMSQLSAPSSASQVNASAGLARAPHPFATPAAASSALCPLLSAPNPYVRANVLVTMQRASVRCGDGGLERRLLTQDSAAVVRLNASRLLRAASNRSPADAKELERCATLDRSSLVAASCADRKPSRLTSKRSSLTVYVLDEAGRSPRPFGQFAAQDADGVVRVGIADARGAFVDPFAPEGPMALVPQVPAQTAP